MVASQNLFMEQGANFKSREIKLEERVAGVIQPIDLSGKTLKAQMRKHSDATLFFEFSVNIIDSINGIIQLEMDSSITSTIKYGRFMYDIFIVEDAEKILNGNVIVNPTATKLV